MTNFKFYGLYKNVRNAAWQCLIDFNINYLPTNVLQITDAAGIKVVKDSDVGILAPNEIGASFVVDDVWHIVYKNTDSRQTSRFTVAHELGHIFLGHELRQGKHTRKLEKAQPKEESEANTFAYRLLAPACVIWGLGLHKADEIASLCDIPIADAKNRADRMKILYERNKFLSSNLEKKVYKNFEEFINKNPR